MQVKEEFIKSIQKYTEIEKSIITKAIDIAIKYHDGQYRDSGEPYVTHPIAVASILVELGLDYETISAALLHDLIEDTEYSPAKLLIDFNANILRLVEGVTKINKIAFKSRIDEQAENLRNMLLAMSHDIRVIIIKLADRLHNMRTLVYKKSEQSRLNKSQETLDIFAPIAARLGMGTIKCELEDLSMKWLYPDEYEKIAAYLSSSKNERENFVKNCTKSLLNKLNELGIKGEVNGRQKHIYSIFKKIQRGKSMAEIYDLMALRVIVPTIKDCYEMLGAIHTMWRPLPGRFKDYIATPKPNRYQSLHTTVFSQFGSPFEIQIRTFDMHKIAEYGIAAHWKYKQRSHFSSNKDNKLAWVNEILENQKEAPSSSEMINSVKLDLYPDEIFVFTPESDVFSLPYGATGLDFAYRIHSEIGNKCIGVKIDSKLMPLKTQLETGNIVEILTSNAQKGPSRDWLNIVQTQLAKNKIKAYFKKVEKDQNIKSGKELLEIELKKKGIKLSELLDSKEEIDKIFLKYNCKNTDEFYASIGCGDIQAVLIANKFYNLKHKDEVQSKEDIKFSKPQKTKNNDGIIISGYEGMLIRYSKCCNPVPGDDIVAYVTRGRGACIHRQDCINVSSFEKERLLPATWIGQETKDSFRSDIFIKANNNILVLSEISAIINSINLKLLALNLISQQENETTITISVEIKNTGQLNNLIKILGKNKNIIEVHRA